QGARCEEGVVLGDDCFVGEHAVINPGVKIYPFKTVEPGAIVNSSIIWESRGARSLFGRSGVSGLANVDVTPELAVQLAMDEATQRKIERYYHREDFRRAFAADIGDIEFPPHAIEYYTAALMRTVDADAIRAAGPKVVLDYAYGTTSFVMPNVLSKLGADVLSVNPYAEAAGARITWTKLSTPALMEVAASGGVDLAASQEGGFIFPRFLPAYDATAAFVNVLELLARSGLRLSKIVAGLPRVSIVHESIVTPWEQKGLVMRTLVERIKDREMVMVDGVKVLYEDGWVLVLPDPEEPITHIWAEAGSDTEARGLAQEYARRIRQMLR